MGRIAGSLAAVLLLLGLVACGDDDEGSATTTTVDDTTTTSEAESGAEVTSSPIAGFDERSVRFANLDYTVTGATVTDQDLRTYADGTDPEPGEETHLILDVEVENSTARQLESDPDTIVLELDGDRAGVADDFLTDATGFIGANETVDGFLAFEVDADAELAGAVVVFGATPDREARLPITGDVDDPDFPIDVDVTGTADGVGPTNGGTLRFELLGAALFDDLPHGDTTSPTGERADEDEVFIQLHVQITKTDGRGNDVIAPDAAFRLLVDDVARSPFDVATAPEGSTPTPTAEPGATVDAWVLFAVDSTASTHVLQVGDPDEATGTIVVELPTIP